MYLITYIINESGYKFLKRINKEASNNSFFEGELFNESIDIELSEELTIFTIGIKYGWFLSEQLPKLRVEKFEAKLCKILTTEKYHFIFRVDESLIEEYWCNYVKNEDWFNEKNAFDKISKWIKKQDTLHWKKIYK